jgi:hypothetical protein
VAAADRSVVALDPDGDHADAMAALALALDAIALSPGLYLVRTDLTQSRLYHLVKRETGSASLLVGRLAGAPKFKGMAPGSLAALRSWEP